MENKRIIVANLAATMKQTRFGGNITEMEYYDMGEVPDRPCDEYVVVRFTDVPAIRVCVTADSGIGIITDVLKGLGVTR